MFCRTRKDMAINCTGIGSKILFGDQGLMPLKGRLPNFVPQPEINIQTTTSYDSGILVWLSGPGELHPEALPEPYVSVSTHTAPIIRRLTLT
jgi:hypothetical protein